MSVHEWACKKGFHAWALIWPKHIEAEVLAGVPHPLPTHYTCASCGIPGPPVDAEANRIAAEAASQGGVAGLAVPVRNDDNGRLFVGDPAAAEWAFEFPSAPPASPPTQVYLPAWIFERTVRGKDARSVFSLLADVRFLGHSCSRCGGEHQLIVWRGARLVDLPCCEGDGH